MERKVRPKRVQIPIDEKVTLEGLVCVPADESEQSRTGVIISHPHPMLGGSMTNNVVGSLLKDLGKAGYCSLCFNFRGTGQSTGKGTWRGGGEREDIKGVCKFMEKEYGVARIVLVGYSYGAAISCSVLNELEIVKAAVAISYPFGVLSFILLGHLLEMAKTSKPIFWLMGAKDNFTASSKFLDRVKALSLLGVEEYKIDGLEEEEDPHRVDEDEGEGEGEGKGGKEKEKDSTKKEKEGTEGEEEKSRASGPALQVYKILNGFDHFWFGAEDVLEDYVASWLDFILSHHLLPNKL